MPLSWVNGCGLGFSTSDQCWLPVLDQALSLLSRVYPESLQPYCPYITWPHCDERRDAACDGRASDDAPRVAIPMLEERQRSVGEGDCWILHASRPHISGRNGAERVERQVAGERADAGRGWAGDEVPLPPIPVLEHDFIGAIHSYDPDVIRGDRRDVGALRAWL